jgi:eukaryotic-like serine/threonine-protein kinase
MVAEIWWRRVNLTAMHLLSAVQGENMATSPAGDSGDIVGQTLGHYRIEAKVGEGGMGVVYKALDTHLDRRVAIKVLRPETLADPERKWRFVREAKSASALNHPNIITVYDIETSSGLDFIAMEYVRGRTLDQLIGRKGLALGEALNYGIQAADALAKAHAAGIVHRDFKPVNIMVTDEGRVKIMDFGLAKLIDSGQADGSATTEAAHGDVGSQTETGAILGTVAYMSPEQAEGKPVDSRSDIYSFGSVLYEMLTGRRPFQRDTKLATWTAILREEPTPISEIVRGTSPELERIIARCLRKDPFRRFQHMSDLKIALEELKEESEARRRTPETAVPLAKPRRLRLSLWVGMALIGLVVLIGYVVWFHPVHPKAEPSPSSSASVPVASSRGTDSLAVLPFVNGSADLQAEYLSDGIAESLINQLSQLPDLKVIARTTAFRYKGNDIDPKRIGHDLGVQAVVTGKVVQRADVLVIQADLVRVADGSQLWGNQYTRKPSDIFAVQEEISREIVKTLRPRLSGNQQLLLTKRHTENTEAYHLYLKGNYSWNKRTEEDLKQGIEYFQQAIAKDPNFALAYAGLAGCYGVLAGSYRNPNQFYPQARAYAKKALEIDKTLAEAHTALAGVKAYHDWDLPGAEIEFKRAIELNPNYPTAHQRYSLLLTWMGRAEESLVEVRRALELDPVSLAINTSLGTRLYYARQYDQALEQFQKTLKLDPNFFNTRVELAAVYVEKGMHEQALAELARSRSREAALPSVGYVYARSGRRSEAESVLAELKELSKKRYVSPVDVAAIYAGLGERDQAFAWLGKGSAEHSVGMLSLKVNPRFEVLRADPRFTDLLRRIGLSP